MILFRLSKLKFKFLNSCTCLNSMCLIVARSDELWLNLPFLSKEVWTLKLTTKELVGDAEDNWD